MANARGRRARKFRRPAGRAPGKPVALAKLTRPRLHAAYARERLFGLLDAHRRYPVVWIAGPPGAGKTTLAATWLDARKLAGIWYQLDSGDSDPATLFYYLRHAAEAAVGGRGALPPLLTSEYLADLPGFGRRWFRELFARLPDGAVIAFDNYQELAPESVVHGLLAAAAQEIPDGAQVLVMSWGEPPPELAGALAKERLARIDPEALQLTLEEAAGIASGRGGLAPAEIRELHASCAGWAAGFTLMRERLRRTGLVSRVEQGGSMQDVFDYFMAQVFRAAMPESRETLVKTAFLPRFTEAMAAELSGSARAGELLESLYRRHLFVERRYGTEVTYQHHVLFRAFLLDQARRYYTALGIAELLQRAAELLERAGMTEDAVQLLLDGGDGAGAARVVEKLAPGIVAAGRGAALREWLDRVPEAERDRRPWLSYWLGAAITGVDPRAARAAYERAYGGFERDGDRTGQAMAVVSVLQTHLLEMDDLTRIGPWLPVLERLFAVEPAFPSADVAARVYGTLVGLMLWAVPTHPLFPACVERLEALLAGPLDPDVKVTAGGQLAEYYGWAGFPRKAERVVAAIEPLAADPKVSPLAREFWCIRTCRGDHAVGDFAAMRRKLDRALRIATENGLQLGLGLVYGLQADVALDLGELDALPAIVERWRGWIPGRGRQTAGRMHWVQARLDAARGELERAARECEEACSIAQHGLALAHHGYRATLVAILTELGELERARAALGPARGAYPPDLFPVQAFRVEAAEAVLAARSGDPSWQAPLRESLRRLRKLGVEIPVTSIPLAARQLSELLLSEDVEAPYVRAWIRKMRLRPSSRDVPGWPWPVSVRALGPFSVERDGAPLTFARKAPRKPLELLQAMVAFGGSEVAAEVLAHALWPDSEGDAADAALKVALSRLRKLLGHDAVTVSQGKLSLDERLCWVDALAFQRLVGSIDRGAPGAGEGARLLDLYRGRFLENEREQPWMLRPRERLRRHFAAAAARVQDALRREGKPEDAASFSRKAIDRDPPSEGIARRFGEPPG